MAPDSCPYCGNPAHSPGAADFECPVNPSRGTEMVGATPAAPMMGESSSRSSASFLHGSSGSAMTTKLGPGTRVGEYVIQAMVGEGGMGSVYSAVHPIIGKKVAIKVLSKQLAKNKNAIQRFVLEARAVNDIHHSGLVDIFSFGRLTDGRHYYVMEFLEGRNLGEVLRDRTHLPMAEAIPIFMEVVSALMAVHSKGIVHRDLKPENIILLDGEKRPHNVKLVDFGLAKLIEGISLPTGGPRPMTAAGVNIGTPHYMSPEQCRGEKVDARSDLYSLGVLLYETLTGFLPIQGSNTVDIWQAHVTVIPRPAHEVCPNLVTPSLGTIISKLLAKHPADRYQDASLVHEALSVFIPGGGGLTGKVEPSMFTAKKRTWTELAESLDRALLQQNLISLDEARHRQTSTLASHSNDDPIDLAELARTSTDLAAIMVPEDGMSAEEEQRGIDLLRKEWGVKIETPIRDPGSMDEAQISALEISLDIPSQSRMNQDLLKTTKDLRLGPTLPNRPIEERTHVPALAAPVVLAPGYENYTPRTLASVPSKKGMIIRGVVFVLLLTVATVAAFVFVR